MTGQKTKAGAAKAGTQADPAAAEEAAILFPDRDITLTDPHTHEPVTITAREFRFLDGLKAQALGAALIEDLAATAAHDGGMTPVRLSRALGDHADTWVDLCALATGRPATWIAALREPDATTLTMAAWQVNTVFLSAASWARSSAARR